MNRGTRRDRTERVASRRAGRHRWMGNPNPPAHTYHKQDPMGHCSNRGCGLCAFERWMKHDAKKAERRSGERELRDQAEEWREDRPDTEPDYDTHYFWDDDEPW
jgi:hypothetical protein